MVRSYLGGAWRRGAAIQWTVPGGRDPANWSHTGGDADLAIQAAGIRLFTWDALALLLRGYARPAGAAGSLDLERVAEEIRCSYLEHGELAVDGLEGSFTLALLDGQARRVLLYRNLVGTGFTYYHAGPDGLLFGSNLAEVLGAAAVPPRPNRRALPTVRLCRCVPGRDTLLEDFQRLRPGEQVTWDRNGLTRVQRHTFADLRGREPVGADALGRLEETMGQVLSDCVALQPGAANLLSGG